MSPDDKQDETGEFRLDDLCELSNGTDDRFCLVGEESPMLHEEFLEVVADDREWDRLRTKKMRELADLHDHIVDHDIRMVPDGEHRITVTFKFDADGDAKPISVLLVPYTATIERYVRLNTIECPYGSKNNLPLSLEDAARRIVVDAQGGCFFEAVGAGTYLIILQGDFGVYYIPEAFGVRRFRVEQDTHVVFDEDDRLSDETGLSTKEESGRLGRRRHYMEG